MVDVNIFSANDFQLGVCDIYIVVLTMCELTLLSVTHIAKKLNVDEAY